jgi:hypothetical protein
MMDTSCAQAHITYELVRRTEKTIPWEYTTKKAAPEGADCKITFLFSTNAACIKLNGRIGVEENQGTFSNFSFTKDHLDVDKTWMFLSWITTMGMGTKNCLLESNGIRSQSAFVVMSI